jgi:hypothetical protein
MRVLFLSIAASLAVLVGSAAVPLESRDYLYAEALPNTTKPAMLTAESMYVDDPGYWLKDMPRQGRSPFNPTAGYQVFRNVKDFGAKGRIRIYSFQTKHLFEHRSDASWNAFTCLLSILGLSHRDPLR